MSNDLISRSRAKEAIRSVVACWRISPCLSPKEAELRADALLFATSIINDQPIAYDVEAVVRTLEELIKINEEYIPRLRDQDEREALMNENSGILQAIEIVKAGG